MLEVWHDATSFSLKIIFLQSTIRGSSCSRPKAPLSFRSHSRCSPAPLEFRRGCHGSFLARAARPCCFQKKHLPARPSSYPSSRSSIQSVPSPAQTAQTPQMVTSFDSCPTASRATTWSASGTAPRESESSFSSSGPLPLAQWGWAATATAAAAAAAARGVREAGES